MIQVSLNRPIRLFIDDNQSVAPYLRQEFIRIREHREGDREAIVAALLTRTFHDRVIVFAQTKRQCHRMHVMLGLLGLKIGELHGDLSQTQRLDTLKRFKNEEIDILIATDIAARGLDIENVKTVINFILPNTLKHYIHRVGRTARVDQKGQLIDDFQIRDDFFDFFSSRFSFVISRTKRNSLVRSRSSRIRNGIW